MSKRSQRIISIILTLVLFTGMYFGLAFILREPSGYAKNDDFYKYADEYDVLITGSSHSLNGILPVELWRYGGIKSYNLSNYGSSLGMDYWNLRNALDYCSPRLVVIDVFTLFFDERYSYYHVPYVRQMVDTMPWGETKIAMIRDMFIDENEGLILNPYSADHFRWETISSYDSEASTCQFGADVNQYFGQDISTELENRLCAAIPEFELLPVPEREEEENISYDYLRRMIEMCQEKGIEVLLVTCPLVAEESRQRHINNVYAIAEQYDVTFINGLRDSNINRLTDFYDTGHLNSSGAYKWTRYLCDIMLENYGLSMDAASAENGEYFTYCSEHTALMLWNRYISNPNVYGCLVLSSNPYFDVSVRIADEELFQDLKLKYLLENIGGYVVDEEAGADIVIELTNSINEQTCVRMFDSVSGEDGRVAYIGKS